MLIPKKSVLSFPTRAFPPFQSLKYVTNGVSHKSESMYTQVLSISNYASRCVYSEELGFNPYVENNQRRLFKNSSFELRAVSDFLLSTIRASSYSDQVGTSYLGGEIILN